MGGDRAMNPQLRGLLQHNNGQPVYVQTAPGVYQAVNPSMVSPNQYSKYITSFAVFTCCPLYTGMGGYCN